MRDAFRQWSIETAELDARLLAMAAIGVDAVGLAVREHEPMPDDAALRLEGLAARRLAGEPVARILDAREFYGLPFALGPATLVPRPETELLVDLGLALLAGKADPRILDLGTGTGAIAIALLDQRSDAQGVATDIAPEALAVAEANAKRHGVDLRLGLRCGSWFGPIGEGERFDLVVSNPPYIASAVIPGLAREVRMFDPERALDGGADGLAAYRDIAKGLRRRLAPGGAALFEIGSDQGEAVLEILRRAGLEKVRVEKDLAGLDRAVLGHQL